jgi:hypothetical protein
MSDYDQSEATAELRKQSPAPVLTADHMIVLRSFAFEVV